MPYTPPSQRSPASSKPSSPVISRNHSYSNNAHLHSHPQHPSQRPSLPRSMSSTSYLQKHRRSPSISDHKPEQPAQIKAEAVANGTKQPLHRVSSNESPSSDDDRGRPVGQPIPAEHMKQIEEALSKLQPLGHRALSPTRDSETALTNGTDGSASAPVPGSPGPALSKEARKISHSRSSSEIQLSSSSRLASTDLPTTHSSDDSDVEDDELRIKPPLLRKKSGELVKPALRPASRRRPSSMPGTPTYSKAVHFNEDIEQVRHFLQVDRPIAVSAGSSPVETYDSESDFPFGYEENYRERKSQIVEWEIKTSNFPRDTFERKSMPIRVERIFLSSDNKSLVGTVAVANLAFNKLVVARFTLDYWKTTSEVVAEYNNDIRKKQANDGCDRFNFNIKLADQANLETKTLLLCVRYNVNGQEFWDNNSNMNYQVDFIKKTKPSTKVQNKGGMQAGPLGAIPRSRQSPPAHSAGRNAHTQPASPDDDFVRNFDNTYQFGVKRVNLETPSNPIRLKNHHRQPPRKGSGLPDEARTSTATGSNQSQAFSTRYDFSASLSAALTNAQNALGDRSGIKPKPSQQTAFNSDGPAAAPKPADAPKPGALNSSSEARPGLQSAEYNDLIQKYCFFGSANGSKASSPPNTTPLKGPEVPTSAPKDEAEKTTALDHTIHSYNSSTTSSATSSAASSTQSSGSNSPTQQQAVFDGSADSRHHSRTPSAYGSRSASPGSVGSFGITARAGSPVPFSSPWQQNILGEGPAAVASHG
ncbi:hypothetical protein NA57DRAFT_65008 [Rhizodiscina lignyota]|uniref:CBM21 domain-containing protein n=1 Tax=Rhizodiscina lignyota TaxID=1504668 RepID=A0A9P4IJL8_9PEZI|nr:hypothetical protein NA57DRAFT_65008 [Rhizodiscina lignyota]